MIKKSFLRLFILWIATRLFTGCHVRYEDASEKDLSVTVYGAAGTVSGSLSLIGFINHKYLVDCGAYYPDYSPDLTYEERSLAATKKNDLLPIEAQNIEAIFVTHAHLDHIGRIPLLVRNGFNGKIYCSSGTKLLMEKMLFSQLLYSDEKRHWVYSERSKKRKKYLEKAEFKQVEAAISAEKIMIK